MKRIYTSMMAAVMFSAVTLTFTACSSEADELLLPDVPEQTEQPTAPKTYTLSVNASKGSDGTRALTIDGNDIIATWTKDDVVTVYNSSDEEIGELTAQTSGANTTLTGTLNEGVTLSLDEALTLKYLSDDYSNQEGTLEYIASHCDYATATVNVSSVNNDGAISTSNAVFENQQAIVKFTLKDQDGVGIQASKLYVTADASTYTITPSAATNVFFVAVPGISEKPVELTVADDERCYYSFTHSSVTFENGNFYPINVTMKNWNEQPLTFEAIKAGCMVKLIVGGAVAGSGKMDYIEYKKEGEDKWTHQDISGNSEITIEVTLDNIGDKVMFRGSNTSLCSVTSFNRVDENTVARFYAENYDNENDCYVYGNVMSLLYGDDFADETSIRNGVYNFSMLFFDNDAISSHPFKTLLLPATTLTNGCYYSMFSDCFLLTKAPELPATTLKQFCYSNMFERCSNLIKAPDLPATTPVRSCYYEMFVSCNSLKSIRCYLEPSDRVQTATDGWLIDAGNDGNNPTFYKKAGTTWPTGTSGIPEWWTVVEE